ncbi:Protein of unknown function (DUF3078) [Gillisia sp. Hel_I_86]|uniref:DUF3078 domain-containing protein n=1 Tax=Gillisia sp. Hel_I_86 TaxID=1249981 RepID=UPI001199A1EF|nr:DUF3078 domain-containing protein [Gillisia sp. Hel_I_86]TVZ26126.1 Protein of unknown function (DUF3078) [Gillisia sp. Hel_I_86]
MKLTFTPVLVILLVLSFSISSSFASRIPKRVSDTTTVNPPKNDSVKKENQDLTMPWSNKNALGVNLSEVAFVNWNAGGNNSVSALFYGNFERKFKKRLLLWKTSASIRYGLNAQEGRKLRKTDDEISLNSTYGYRRDSTSNFRYSAKFNFKTQFANGYKYPQRDKSISSFMAPGYAFLGVGAEYSAPNEDLTVYLSPLTDKSTFVLDQRLANEGMFGVTPAVRDSIGNIVAKGENVRTEFGVLLTSNFSKEVFTNVNLDNQISFYTDYLNKFGNIDVDWELKLNLVVNEFVKANIGSHLIYDDDVKFKEDTNDDGALETLGPKIQFKQLLGVGLMYEF